MNVGGIQELVNRVRQKYVDYFVLTVEELAAGCENPHASEVKFANIDSFYKGLVAVDFASNDGEPNLQFINSDTYLRFSPDIRVQTGGLDVSISPFSWDKADFRFDTRVLDHDLFDEWFQLWFDVDDERETAELLGNIIHSALLSDGHLAIDFGSAKVDAFWHLLDVISKSGVRSLEIGSDDIAQPLH